MVVDRDPTVAERIVEVLAVRDGDVVKPAAEQDKPRDNWEILDHSFVRCEHAKYVANKNYEEYPEDPQQRQWCEKNHFSVMVQPIIISCILIWIQCIGL